MPQIALFPLSDEELQAKAKALAEALDARDALVEDKDAMSRDFNERIKKVESEMRLLAKAIRLEQEEREASDDEAPWAGLIDQAVAVARGRGQGSHADLASARGPGRKRDRTGEYAEEDEP